MNRFFFVATLLPALAGCDVLKDRMGLPDPAKVEAQGKAVGGACRHAGRGLEDCYRINPEADKPAVFSGWKEMNEYMLKNNMQSVTPEIPLEMTGSEATKSSKAKNAEADEQAVDDENKDDEQADKADKAEKGTDKRATDKGSTKDKSAGGS
jgi:hypothetical protein